MQSKTAIALYVCEPPLVAKQRARLGAVDGGKRCIRFTHLDDLNLEGVEALLTEAAGKA